MKLRTATSIAVLVGLSYFATVSPAHAQDQQPSAADVATARSLSQDGTKLANAGHCAEAIDKLSRSEKLFHAPSTLERLAFCQAKLGKVVEASENLNRVTRETLPANAPKAFVRAQERAAKLLPSTRARIAKLRIDVTAPPNTTFAVSLDGEALSSASVGTDRLVDPGEHAVEVSAPGMITAKNRATLRDGESISVAMELKPDPNAPKAAPTPPVASGTPGEKTDTPAKQPPGGVDVSTDRGSSRIPAYAALGVGVIGVGVGSVFGLLASGKKGDLDAACTSEKRCPETQESTLDSAKSLATISTIGFVVGAVGLVAGGVLFFTSSPSKTAGRGPTATVGLGTVGLSGSF